MIVEEGTCDELKESVLREVGVWTYPCGHRFPIRANACQLYPKSVESYGCPKCDTKTQWTALFAIVARRNNSKNAF